MFDQLGLVLLVRREVSTLFTQASAWHNLRRRSTTIAATAADATPAFVTAQLHSLHLEPPTSPKVLTTLAGQQVVALPLRNFCVSFGGHTTTTGTGSFSGITAIEYNSATDVVEVFLRETATTFTDPRSVYYPNGAPLSEELFPAKYIVAPAVARDAASRGFIGGLEGPGDARPAVAFPPDPIVALLETQLSGLKPDFTELWEKNPWYAVTK